MIRHIPLEERPRERCLHQGASSLSLRECIAVILGTGTRNQSCLDIAQQLLERPGASLTVADEEHAFFTAMESTGSTALMGIPGIGKAGQARLLAAMELARRYLNTRSRLIASESRDGNGLRRRVLDAVPQSWRNHSQEWIGFVPIYASGHTGGFCLVERGVRTHVNFDPTDLFAPLLALRPREFFLFHNHPSGVLSPSAEDIELTRRANRLAEGFGIRCGGHAIVSALGYQWIVL